MNPSVREELKAEVLSPSLGGSRLDATFAPQHGNDILVGGTGEDLAVGVRGSPGIL